LQGAHSWIDTAGWVKAARSSGNSCCVELLFLNEYVLVRDSKHRRNHACAPTEEPIISVSRVIWEAFLADLERDDQVWMNEVLSVAVDGDGSRILSCSDSLVSLRYTRKEWDAFLDGVANREFAAL
jgi:hypothetical protein